MTVRFGDAAIRRADMAGIVKNSARRIDPANKLAHPTLEPVENLYTVKPAIVR